MAGRHKGLSFRMPKSANGCCLQFPFPEENPQLAELLADHADEECLAMRPDPGSAPSPVFSI